MSEPLCQCGPVQYPGTDAPLESCPVHGGPQSYVNFPSSPPARSRADAEKAIAAVLVEHGIDPDPTTPYQCMCGVLLVWNQDNTVGKSHRAHVASVLADLMADGPALADAWDEGHRTGFSDCSRYLAAVEFNRYPRPTDTPNPYREDR